MLHVNKPMNMNGAICMYPVFIWSLILSLSLRSLQIQIKHCSTTRGRVKKMYKKKSKTKKTKQTKKANVMTAAHCPASHSHCCKPQWTVRSTESGIHHPFSHW